MATIFERAFQFAYDKCGCRHCNVQCKYNDMINMDGTCGNYNKYMKLYIDIATDQRKIDIDFVRFWLCDHVVGTTLTAHDIEELTKAMEE